MRNMLKFDENVKVDNIDEKDGTKINVHLSMKIRTRNTITKVFKSLYLPYIKIYIYDLVKSIFKPPL